MLVFINLHGVFFTMNFEDWLLHNVLNDKKSLIKGMHWELVFANIVWRLWKGRNMTIFNEQNLSTDAVITINLSWVRVTMQLRVYSCDLTAPR